MGAIGAAASIAGPWLQQKRAAGIERGTGLNEAGIRESE
jgi:hypothetical protein